MADVCRALLLARLCAPNVASCSDFMHKFTHLVPLALVALLEPLRELGEHFL